MRKTECWKKNKMMDGPKEILILMVKLLGLIFEVDDDNC
jgi:hypothetical protein